MMSPPPQYRRIQPAPGKSARPGASSGASSSGWLKAKGLTKRLKAVTQACHTCRRNKAKCDGVRPRCGGCTARASQCGYEGEAGQSRQAALRARLEALEKLVSDLQSASDADAERILQRVRSGTHDIGTFTSTDAEARSTRASTLAASSTSPESTFPGGSPGASSPAVSKSSITTLSVDGSSGTPVAPPGHTEQRLADGDPAFSLLLQPPLPSAQTTWAGIESFFSSSGRLFHVFSPQQMEAYYRTVFGIDGKADTTQKLAICCLCSVAAVGIQYNPSDFQKGLEKTFHDVSRRFFSEVIEERALDTIKVCTLFAMYNILDKATVALAYVEVGLSMSKRQSQNTGVCHPSMVSADEWIDFRRTWRALIFCSSWLSSTLGYISGTDDSEFTKLFPIAEQDHDSYSAELGELVQAEMTKISLLKAGILRNHLAVQELTTLGMDGIIRELQDWHEQLPEPMKLRSLYRDDWSPLVRWSIYHLHLLYHGAFMLVYRRVAAHCIRLQRTGGDVAAAGHGTTLMSLIEQGITSARHTARIVSLLLSEQGVFKRCWIVIFQAHTACVVILHSIAQKQLHRFPPSSWAEDLKRAQQCIDVLGYCGNVDPVALRFRVRLSGIYSSLVGSYPLDQATHNHNMQRIEEWVPPYPGDSPSQQQEPHPLSYLFTPPPRSSPSTPSPILLSLSFTLLFALCRPWSDTPTATTHAASSTDATTAITTPSVTEGGDTCGGSQDGVTQGQGMELERLEWDFEKVTPFRWDTDGLGMLREGEVVGTSCFLDSEAPSGWMGAEDVEGPEEEAQGSGQGEGVMERGGVSRNTRG